MLLALVLALANAPQVEEEIEVHVVVRRFPFAKGVTTVGVKAEGSEEELFEVALEDGKGSLKLVPPGPPPHDLRIVDDRFDESRIVAARSEPKILYTLGRETAHFRVWYSEGRVDLGWVDWVYGDMRYRVLDHSLKDSMEIKGLLPLEGAHLEASALGGIPFRIDMASLTAPPQVQRFFVPEETVTVRVLDENGTPVSGLECLLVAGSYVAPPKVVVTDGHGRATFEGVVGESIVQVDFGDHLTAMETFHLDPNGTGEVILTCPPSSEVLFDTSALSEETIERLELMIFPANRTLDSRPWIKLSELEGPVRVAAEPQRVLTRFAESGASFRIRNAVLVNPPRQAPGDSIEVRPGERVTHTLTTKHLPGLVELSVSVDGKATTNFEVSFEASGYERKVYGWRGPALLPQAIYDVTITPRNSDDWIEEFELELDRGEVVQLHIEIENDK